MSIFSARLCGPVRRYSRGAIWEERALVFLQQQDLRLVKRNYRCKVGEIDLIMRDMAGRLIFVEVRARGDSAFGGAAASITARKKQRLIRAAAHYLLQAAAVPVCQFDVVAFEGDKLSWHRNAFDAYF